MKKDFFDSDKQLLGKIADWSWDCISKPSNLSSSQPDAQAAAKLAAPISRAGIGTDAAMQCFTDAIVPTLRRNAHPLNLGYIPSSPTPAAIMFDLAVSAAATAGTLWDGAKGAIQAENQALRWLADLAGLPEQAGGTFVSGGTVGNLSALHAARNQAPASVQGRLIASSQSHSSIASAARVMNVQVDTAELDEHGHMSAASVAQMLEKSTDYFAVVATAGSTNSGKIDDLAAIAKVCKQYGIWMHVDGAYGLAALASPTARSKFAGIEFADSFIVDPHKWLFAPYDCCALLYRNPQVAREAHMQQASYLNYAAGEVWHPGQYAFHLTRRARGLPFWFSLMAYGSDRYGQAIDKVLETTAQIAACIEDASYMELVAKPELSIILFRKKGGMSFEQIQAWCEDQFAANKLFSTTTQWKSEWVLRLALTNPDTDAAQVLDALASLR